MSVSSLRTALFLPRRVGFLVAIVDADGDAIVDVLVVFEKYRIAPRLIRGAAFHAQHPIARFGQSRRPYRRYFRGAREFGRRKYGCDGCRDHRIAGKSVV